MRRQSERKIEQEKRAAQDLALQHDAQKKIINSLFDQLTNQFIDKNSNSQELEYLEYDIPESWKSLKFDLSNSENIQGEDSIYKKIKQNLYRQPLIRPPFVLDDSPVCNCVDECGSHCQNRLLYMFVYEFIILLFYISLVFMLVINVYKGVRSKLLSRGCKEVAIIG